MRCERNADVSIRSSADSGERRYSPATRAQLFRLPDSFDRGAAHLTFNQPARFSTDGEERAKPGIYVSGPLEDEEKLLPLLGASGLPRSGAVRNVRLVR